MYIDRDIDRHMGRTSSRPLVTGDISGRAAVIFATVLGALSIAWLWVFTTPLAALLSFAAILFYVFVYTMWLKRSTPQNIVIGGAAGAFPPMIGWAAVTGSVSVESLVLFSLIFFWTPPHFWALALYRRGDYADAGVPMLPVVAGVRETKKQMLIYTVLLFPLAIAPYWLGVAGPLYGMAATVLGGLFLLSAIAVWRDAGDRAAKRMFGYSIFYLFAIFGAMILDRGTGLLG